MTITLNDLMSESGQSKNFQILSSQIFDLALEKSNRYVRKPPCQMFEFPEILSNYLASLKLGQCVDALQLPPIQELIIINLTF